MLAQRSWVHTARRILGDCPSRLTDADRVRTDRVDTDGKLTLGVHGHQRWS